MIPSKDQVLFRKEPTRDRQRDRDTERGVMRRPCLSQFRKTPKKACITKRVRR